MSPGRTYGRGDGHRPSLAQVAAASRVTSRSTADAASAWAMEKIAHEETKKIMQSNGITLLLFTASCFSNVSRFIFKQNKCSYVVVLHFSQVKHLNIETGAW